MLCHPEIKHRGKPVPSCASLQSQEKARLVGKKGTVIVGSKPLPGSLARGKEGAVPPPPTPVS